MKINNVTANNTAKPVAFTSKLGNVGKNVLETYIEPQRKGNMSRNLFVTAAFAFLLSGRIFNSRDNNERRETITRDIPTIFLAINGVPLFEKITAKMVQKQSGVAIMSDAAKGSIGTADQIHDWYRFDKTLASGFDGFMTRLDVLGGNFKKTASTLSEDIKGKLANFSENNETFRKQLSSKEHKGLKQTIMDEFGKEGNAAFKEASFKKSLPKLAGIATTLVLVGFCIPKVNIALTEYLSKKKTKTESKPSETVKAEQPAVISKPIEAAKTEPVTPDMQTANMKTAQNSSSDSTKKAFAQFIN